VNVLFDSGATHSFISAKLIETLGLDPTQKSSLLTVMLPNGKTVSCEELYEGCPVKMYECKFPATCISSTWQILGLSSEWTG